MPNFLRRLLGFAAGAGLCFYLLVSVFSSAGLVPKGAGWFFLIIFSGVLGARVASAPRKVFEKVSAANKPLSNRWWGLEKGLRLSIFLAGLWIVGSHIWIDSYDRNFANSYAPALMILGAYFGFSMFVKEPDSRADVLTPVQDVDAPREFLAKDVNVINSDDIHAAQTSKDREREMNDLISRMNPPRK